MGSTSQYDLMVTLADFEQLSIQELCALGSRCTKTILEHLHDYPLTGVSMDDRAEMTRATRIISWHLDTLTRLQAVAVPPQFIICVDQFYFGYSYTHQGLNIERRQFVSMAISSLSIIPPIICNRLLMFILEACMKSIKAQMTTPQRKNVVDTKLRQVRTIMRNLMEPLRELPSSELYEDSQVTLAQLRFNIFRS